MNIGIFGSSDPRETEAFAVANQIGQWLAKDGHAVVTGACLGVPFEAVKGAKSCNGVSIGFSAVTESDQHESVMGTPNIFYDRLVCIPKEYQYQDRLPVCKKYRNVSSLAFCDAAINIHVQGDGLQTRAFVYIDDAAEAVCRLLDAGEHRTIYNIGTDEEVSISKVINLIGKSLGRSIETISGPVRAGGTLRRCPDIARLKSLGHVSRVRLGEGVQRLVEWYSANQSLWPEKFRSI